MIEATVWPYLYPSGPVVALQVLNEGIYSNGNRGLLSYDYSASFLKEYHPCATTRWPPAPF